jgi:hypothetical protein
MNELLSVVVNADTRSGFLQDESKVEEMFNGCRSVDFLTDAIQNKRNFFTGFEIEVILFIDQHEEIPESVLAIIRPMVDTLVIRKHDKKFRDIKQYEKFNDLNYLGALQLARGSYIAHFDGDSAAFTSSPEPIHEMIKLLDQYAFVSYPSHWSPRAVHDESFGKRTWASTRFFMCKREALKFDALMKCIEEPEWAYATYGDSLRRCNWLEHFLSITNSDSVFYPPMDLNNYTIFSWGSYKTGTLSELNKMSYEEIKGWLSSHPIIYPNDIHI